MIRYEKYTDMLGYSDELHYHLHKEIMPAYYPHVHNFYEFSLVVSGKMIISIENENFLLEQGSLALIRPGDVHSKATVQSCEHINLALPAITIDTLFQYLNTPKEKEKLLSPKQIHPIVLNQVEFHNLYKRLQDIDKSKTNLEDSVPYKIRTLVFDILSHYFLENTRNLEHKFLFPPWLQTAIENWNCDANRNKGLDFLCDLSGYNKAYICRSFKKHCGLSATEYLNFLRIQHCQDLLLHQSSDTIVDIAFASGFNSMSRFYDVFRSICGVSPKEYIQYHCKSH